MSPYQTHNDSNVDFYNAIDMTTFAHSAGLESCPDLDAMEVAVRPDRRHDKVLEVGAGYGRVVSGLLDRGYQNVYAIERSTSTMLIEVGHFDAIDDGRLQVLRQDVRRFRCADRFDVILWMFSGIADFSADEQERVLLNLADHLAPGGRLVLDLPPIGQTNATWIDGRTQRIELPEFPAYHGTVPTDTEILSSADRIGFRCGQRVRYQPILGKPERDRRLFVLSGRRVAGMVA